MPVRPLSVTIAVVLLALGSLLNVITPLMPMMEGIPAGVVYAGVVLGVLGLVGALGLWMLKRWALWLTIVVCILNILAAAPGMLGAAPTTTLHVLATIGVVGFALVIVLAVVPASRRAYT
jgi:uncharacterized membrane protein (DUF2068 family)